MVSAGCQNCYAAAISHRFKRTTLPWTKPNAAENVKLHHERLMVPASWSVPSRIFVNSMSDLFHELVPDQFIADVFDVMGWTARHHTYQILTKRPERMAELVPRILADKFVGGQPPPNVWLGTSVEDQRAADERIPHLLATPAAVRFLSCEPLLGPVNLERHPHGSKPDPQSGVYPAWYSQQIDWCIVGGESGPKARPMHPDWPRALREQCVAAGVPFFFKQWGEWAPTKIVVGGDLGGDLRRGHTQHLHAPGNPEGHFTRGDAYVSRVGKHNAGRLLDRREWNEFPVVGGGAS